MADLNANEQTHQESQETEVPDPEKFVPKEEYEQLKEQLLKAQTYEEKAELFDQLVADPMFQKFLDDDGTPAPPADTSPAKPPAKGDDKLVEKLQAVIEPIQNQIKEMKEVYQADQEEALKAEADRQIEMMTRDEKNFPFFKDKEVKSTMAKLLETGRAANMVDAYRLAAFDKAKAEGRSEVLGKEKKKIMPASAKSGEKRDGREAFQGGKKSLRDYLASAFDEHNVQITGEEEGD